MKLSRRLISFEPPLLVRRASINRNGDVVRESEAEIRGLVIERGMYGAQFRFSFKHAPTDQTVRPTSGEKGHVIDFDADRGAVLHRSTFAAILWSWNGDSREVRAVALSHGALQSSYRFKHRFDVRNGDETVPVFVIRPKRYHMIVRRARPHALRGYTEAGEYVGKVDFANGVKELWEVVSAEIE